MCGYFCIGLIDFMLKDKSLLECKDLLFPNDYKKNDKITLKYFQKQNLHCVICGKYRKFEKHKISYLLEKTLVLSIICSKFKNEDGKLFKNEESVEVLKVLCLIENI